MIYVTRKTVWHFLYYYIAIKLTYELLHKFQIPLNKVIK